MGVAGIYFEDYRINIPACRDSARNDKNAILHRRFRLPQFQRAGRIDKPCFPAIRIRANCVVNIVYMA